MLLNHGLIRVGLPIPANAEFELVAVDDPVPLRERDRAVAVPPPAAVDERQVPSTVMWDGRETVPGADDRDRT